MKKIRCTSHILYLFFKILCWAIPFVSAYFILFHIETMLSWGIWSSIISSNQIQDSTHYSLTHRLIILAIQMFRLSVTVLICANLAKLFGLYKEGNLFEVENIKLVKNISIFMILGEIIQLIYQPLMTAALSFNNPVGERFATISLGTANASTVITALIILVASWIIKEANQLKSDSQLTI